MVNKRNYGKGFFESPLEVATQKLLPDNYINHNKFKIKDNQLSFPMSNQFVDYLNHHHPEYSAQDAMPTYVKMNGSLEDKLDVVAVHFFDDEVKITYNMNIDLIGIKKFFKKRWSDFLDYFKEKTGEDFQLELFKQIGKQIYNGDFQENRVDVNHSLGMYNGLPRNIIEELPYKLN